MSNVSLYTEMKLALENEVNIKLLSSIPDVAIVAIGSNSTHLLEYLLGAYYELGLPIENIRRIVICDKDVFKAKRRYADSEVSTQFEYHDVNVKFVSSIEDNYPPSLLTVVLSSELGKASLDGVYAYGIALTVGREFDMSSTLSSLTKLKFNETFSNIDIPESCFQRRNLFRKLYGNDASKGFYHALEGLKNGCETCVWCSSYKAGKTCPFFQLKIAGFYEHGKVVPKNLPMSIQWKKKAVLQGFGEAELSLADTYLANPGLMSNPDELFQLLVKHAEKGDRHAVQSLLDFATSIGRISLTLPWYARLANSGDFDAQNRIIDLYTSGEDGIPISKEEEDRWIEVALACGNRTFVSDIAQSYIDKEDWASAFKWYNRLRGEEDFDEEKLVEIFENYCESEDLTAEQYADRGNQYYYGIDVDEIPRLAYFCF